MLLIALAILLSVWAIVVAVIVCLCIGAARADREAVRQRHLAVRRRAPVFRLAAHR